MTRLDLSLLLSNAFQLSYEQTCINALSPENRTRFNEIGTDSIVRARSAYAEQHVSAPPLRAPVRVLAEHRARTRDESPAQEDRFRQEDRGQGCRVGPLPRG